jgi:transcriptional regulator
LRILLRLPSLPEQEKIASIISTADTEISTLEKQLAAYKQQKRGLMQLLPTVNQLSHQDKLRLIHFLLLAVAKEEGCNLETSDTENTLLNQLASTSATVWSPQADNKSLQALSDLLATAKENYHA